MPLPAMSLDVVGADYPNKKGPGRRFEIKLCQPGEPVELCLEPRNKADPNAVAVLSDRGIQIGYLRADRAPRFASMIRQGREITPIFQSEAEYGAIIRVAFDGEEPTLPAAVPQKSTRRAPESEDQDFWPDYIPPDD